MRNPTLLYRPIVCLIVLLGCLSCAPVKEHSPTLETFEMEVADIMRHWGAPGVIITIVKDGETVLARGFGNTKVAGGSPVTSTTLTSVGSVTKPITSTALAMLAEDGAIDLDDPVKEHIPEFQFVDAYRTEKTTLRDLIAHRSGLPSYSVDLVDMEYTVEDLLRDLPTAEPQIEFRQRMAYSQDGIALLGEIFSRTSEMSWASFVQTRILDPLEMSSTYPGTRAFLDANPEPDEVTHLMGRAVRKNEEIVDTLWGGVAHIYSPAGGVVTTGGDMATFMSFLLDSESIGSSQLLSQDTIEEIFTPQLVTYVWLVNPLTKMMAYGLGCYIHEYEGRRIVEHPGRRFGSSVVALMPDDGIGVFVSTGASYSYDSDIMVSALKFTAFDYALGQEGRDWRSLLDPDSQ